MTPLPWVQATDVLPWLLLAAVGIGVAFALRHVTRPGVDVRVERVEPESSAALQVDLTMTNRSKGTLRLREVEVTKVERGGAEAGDGRHDPTLDAPRDVACEATGDLAVPVEADGVVEGRIRLRARASPEGATEQGAVLPLSVCRCRVLFVFDGAGGPTMAEVWVEG